MQDPSPIHYDEDGIIVDKNENYVNVDENMNPYCTMYGLEELPLSRNEIVAGEKDPQVLKEKLDTAKYII